MVGDNFHGDNTSLINSARALLALDEKGALTGGGIGGHARTIIGAFITRMSELGERQEAVAWSLRLPDGRTTLEKAYPKWAEGEGDGYAIQPLYTEPQPAQDVSGLVEALEASNLLLRTKRHACSSNEVCRVLDVHIERNNAALAAHRPT